MQIQLTNPCSVSASELTQTNNGSYCNVCQKSVIDYSNMGDEEYYNSIKKHGLGCGKFRDDQLDRDIVARKKKRKWYTMAYIAVLTILFTKPAQSQCRGTIPDTVQLPAYEGCKQESYARIEETPVQCSNNTIRKFGTGNIVKVRKEKRYGIFWKNFKLCLFKIRTK